MLKSPEALLSDRDYTVIVAKTAVNLSQSPPKFSQRWEAAHDSILALVHQCQALDPDGINLYISSKTEIPIPFKHYRQVTAEVLQQIFAENYPPDALSLRDGLQLALDDYFTRKAAGQTKPNGEIIIVLIDGEPDDRGEIVKAIVAATEQIASPQELGIGFAQVGENLIARGFLTALDENLNTTAGAKFDIVKTIVLNTIEPNSLTQFLLDIVQG
jgi:hypothetical protein